MVEEISYESQNLAQSLNIYRRWAALLGRSFFKTKNNKESQLVEYITRPKNLIIFVLTSLIIWFVHGLIIVSILDIQSTNDTTDFEL